MFEASLQVAIFYNVLLIITFFTSFLILVLPNYYKINVPLNTVKTILLAVFALVFIGYREWWVEDVFVDSIRYGYSYLSINWSSLDASKDLAFDFLQLMCKSLGFTVDQFFLICAFLYISPLVLLCKRIGKKNSSLFFLVCILSMSFYGYGVNGIRNGIATSFMLLAFTYSRKPIIQICIFILSLGFHLSVLLPIVCYILIPLIKRDKFYLYIWTLAIPLSFVFSGTLTSIVENISFLEERAGSYLSGEASLNIFSRTGFRYDFLIYSFLPIGIRISLYRPSSNIDVLYNNLFYTYVMSNAVWILVNQVPFSNRFAYLSWCIMPFISLYPILKWKSKYRFLLLSIFITCYFMFTYLLKVL